MNSIRFPPEENLEKGFCLIAGHVKKDQIHCYGDSGSPAMYYPNPPKAMDIAFVIGIGYSYKKCEAGGPPTKFVKISHKIIKWLSQRAKNIIEENLEECNLGKGLFGPTAPKTHYLLLMI